MTKCDGTLIVKYMYRIQIRDEILHSGEYLISAKCCLTAHRWTDRVKGFWSNTFSLFPSVNSISVGSEFEFSLNIFNLIYFILSA